MNHEVLRRLSQVIANTSIIPIRERTPPDWFKYRKDQIGDSGIFESVVGNNEYNLESRNLKGATVLDIGGHIGCFAYIAKKCGASLVHSYEPFPTSYELLLSNTTYLNTRCFNSAIGYSNTKGKLPTTSEVVNTGGWSIVESEDGPIDIIGLDVAILRICRESPTGRINLLKIDCEGGEWPAFSGCYCLDLVDEIVGEWHDYLWNDKYWVAEDLHRLLPQFKVTIYPPAPNAHWGLFTAKRE